MRPLTPERISAALARRWHRLGHHRFTKRKISRANIDRLARAYASDERTLVLHPEANPAYWPDAFVVSKRERDAPDLLVDTQFHGLEQIDSESYPLIICIGLLEHIADPHRFVGELHRILEPGGKVVLSASSAFSLHECPEDFFHYTPFGMEVLFKGWDHFEVLRGSSGPFETIGILIQRIHIQSEITPPVRPLVEALVHLVPKLDRFVKRQYNTVQHFDERSECDTMLPSNIQAVVVK
jgi:SAM-dependent methyltransferase